MENNYKIQYYRICAVSNNSRITQSILNAINEKFSDSEKRDFEAWLNIVKDKIDSKSKSTFNF